MSALLRVELRCTIQLVVRTQVTVVEHLSPLESTTLPFDQYLFAAQTLNVCDEPTGTVTATRAESLVPWVWWLLVN
jgi:hypothetical protein